MALRSTLARAGRLPLSLPSPSAMLPNNVAQCRVLEGQSLRQLKEGVQVERV